MATDLAPARTGCLPLLQAAIRLNSSGMRTPGVQAFKRDAFDDTHARGREPPVKFTMDLNECPMTFDVFGRLMQIERYQNEWRAYRPGNDGKRRPSSLAIPSFIQAHEMEQYLTDIFHENASPRHPEVLRLK